LDSSSDSALSQDEDPGIHAIALPPSRVEFVPLKGKVTIAEEHQSQLRRALDDWRTDRIAKRGSRCLLSPAVYLPDKVLEGLVENAGSFLTRPTVQP